MHHELRRYIYYKLDGKYDVNKLVTHMSTFLNLRLRRAHRKKKNYGLYDSQIG